MFEKAYELLITKFIEAFSDENGLSLNSVVARLLKLCGFSIVFLMFLGLINSAFYYLLFSANILVGPAAIELSFRESEINKTVALANKKVIDVWDMYNPTLTSKSIGEDERELRDNTERYLGKVSGFATENLTNIHYVYLNYHLAYLLIINADINGDSKGFFVAEHYISLAQNRIKSFRSDNEFAEFIVNGNYNKDLNWLKMIAKAFQYSRVFTENTSFRANLKSDMDNLKDEIGGCATLISKSFYHSELKDVLCPGFPIN